MLLLEIIRKIKIHCLFYTVLMIAIVTCSGHVCADEKSRNFETVNLQLKWEHQFQFAGYYAAIQQGYYAQEGLEVNILAFNPAKPVVEQVLSGDADYGIADVGILFNYANGQPIKAMAAIFQHNPLVYISKQSSGIISPYEMPRKRIMQQEMAGDDAPLKAMLADAGVTDSQYQPVKFNFNMDDFIAGKVDVIPGYLSNEPYQLRERNIDINIIKPLSYGIDFYGDLLFSSEDEFTRHPGRADRFLKASLKGWAYALAHSEEIIQLIKQHYDSSSSIERLRNEASAMRNLILADMVPLGQIKVERLRHVADVYNRLGLSRELTDNELRNFIYPQEIKVALTDKELAWLRSHPVIRLGIDPNFAPYEWIDEDGNYQGIAADYIRLIEQRLNIKFDVRKEYLSWHSVLESARKGDVDMMSCLVKTADREAFLNFTEPYLTSSAVIISEQSTGFVGSLEHLAGKVVAIQKGHYTEELLAKNYPRITIITTSGIGQALRMVADGRAFAYVGDVTSASYVMKKNGLLNLVFSGSTPYNTEIRFATLKDNPVFYSIINKTLASISEQERNDIYTRWRSLQISQGINTDLIIKYFLVISGLFLLFAYWIFRLRVSELALKESEAKLQLIIDTVPECVKILDTEERLVQINPAGLRMIEGEEKAEEMLNKKVDVMVLKDYRDAFNEMNARVLKGENCNLQYQIMGFKGTVRWVDSHSVQLVDKKNNKVAILAVTRDITELKRTEEAQKIASLVYQNTSEGIMVTDSDNLIIAINPAFSKITGYSFDQVKGKNPNILRSTSQDALFYETMWDSLNRTGHWEGEISNQRKNGDEYIQWLIINTIYTEDGRVGQRVALFSDITEKKKAEQLIWQQANYDALTGLANRNMFLDRLKQDLKIAMRSEKLLAVIYLDLDRFKEVNDNLGHDKGDELLCETAKRLTACVRESDTIARMGGDEFVLVLPELDDTHSVERIAQNIIQALSLVFKLGNEHAYVSASLGLALFPHDAKTAEDLIKHADQAMYISKELGRSRFSYFTKALQEKAEYRVHLMNDLHSALVENQLELYYQPIVDLVTGKIVKAEALIRWNHPQRGFVSPADFIPLAEDTGLIIGIGDWVFKQAAEQVLQWRERYAPNIQVSINKSPIQFRAATNRDDWLGYLKQINLSADAIVIEITEGLLMDDSMNVAHQLLQYRDSGIQVSVDDFGTGYSSLSYIKKFHIDYLKIDKSFIHNLKPDSNDMAISEAIILMAHQLNLKVIAEGVETNEQSQLLLAAGCDYGQGYFYSKAVSSAEFELLLAEK